MANIDNECKDLVVIDYHEQEGYKTGKCSISDLYNLQAKTQQMYFEKQGKKQFSEYNIGDTVDFLLTTNHALVDEIHEMMDAVGGIKDGVGNAAWKPWKEANTDIRSKKLSDLSEGDLKELKMEWIDAMHFMFNMGLAIGVTPSEFYNYYLSKNEENWRRAADGY